MEISLALALALSSSTDDFSRTSQPPISVLYAEYLLSPHPPPPWSPSMRRVLLAAALSLFLGVSAWAQDVIGSHDMVGVPARDARALSWLNDHGYPLEAFNAGGLVEIVAGADDQARMRAARIPFVVLQENLEDFYAARLRNDRRDVQPPFGSGSMGGYHTLAEVEAILDSFHTQFPALTTAKWSLGKSVENRDVWAIKISDHPGTDENEPEVRIDSLHHAREPVSMEMTLFFMDWLLTNYGTDPLATYLVDEREIYLVPIVNPDGYEYNRQTNPQGGGLWRKNRRNNGGGSFGVDLNRNYSYQWGGNGSSGDSNSETYRGPSPFSEPE